MRKIKHRDRSKNKKDKAKRGEQLEKGDGELGGGGNVKQQGKKMKKPGR